MIPEAQPVKVVYESGEENEPGERGLLDNNTLEKHYEYDKCLGEVAPVGLPL